jgi:hypothetical protein
MAKKPALNRDVVFDEIETPVSLDIDVEFDEVDDQQEPVKKKELGTPVSKGLEFGSTTAINALPLPSTSKLPSVSESQGNIPSIAEATDKAASKLKPGTYDVPKVVADDNLALRQVEKEKEFKKQLYDNSRFWRNVDKQEAEARGYNNVKELYKDREPYLINNYLSDDEKVEANSYQRFLDAKKSGNEKLANEELQNYLNAKQSFRAKINEEKQALDNLERDIKTSSGMSSDSYVGRQLSPEEIEGQLTEINRRRANLDNMQKTFYDPKKQLENFVGENATEIAAVAKPSQTAEEKLQEYTNALYTEVLTRRKELGLDETQSGFGEYGTDFMLRREGKGELLDELYAKEQKLRNATKILYLNRTPLEDETASGVFGKSFVKNISPAIAAKTDANQVVANNIKSIVEENNLGQAVYDEQKEFADEEAKEYKPYSSKWFAAPAGASAAIALEFIPASLATEGAFAATNLGRYVNLAEKYGKVKGLNTTAKYVDAIRKYKTANVGDKIGKFILKTQANGLKFGTTSEVVAQLFPSQEDEVNFTTGYFGGTIGKGAESVLGGAGATLFRTFGNKAPEAAKAISDLGEKLQFAKNLPKTTIGEIGEESGETLGQIYSQSDSWKEIKQKLDDQFGTLDKATQFVIQTGIMAIGIGAGTQIGSNMFQASKEAYNNLSRPERAKVDEVLDDVTKEEEAVIKDVETGIKQEIQESATPEIKNELELIDQPNATLTNQTSPVPVGEQQVTPETVESPTGTAEGSGVVSEPVDTGVEVAGTEPTTSPDTEGSESGKPLKDQLIEAGKIVLDDKGEVKDVKQNSGKSSDLFRDLTAIIGDKEKALDKYLEIKDDEGAFKKEVADWENKIMRDYGRSGREYDIRTVKPNDKNNPPPNPDDYAWSSEVNGKPVIYFNDSKLSRNVPFEQQKSDFINTQIDPEIAIYEQQGNQEAVKAMKEYKALFEKNVNSNRDIKLHLIHNEMYNIMNSGKEITIDDIAKNYIRSVDEVARLNTVKLAKDYFGEPMIYTTGAPEGITKFKKPGEAGYKKNDPFTGSEGLYFSRDIRNQEKYAGFDKGDKPAKGRDLYYTFLKYQKTYHMDDPQAQAQYPINDIKTITTEQRKALEALGYDAIIQSSVDRPKEEVVVFDPDQIEIIGTYNKGLIENEKTNENIPKTDKTDTGVPDGQEQTEEKGSLTDVEKSNLEKIGEETGVNFRAIQNVYNKYGEGKPLNEITTDDYQKAQKKREEESESKGRPLKVAKRFLESENYDEDFKDDLKKYGTSYIPEKEKMLKEEAKAYVDVFEENGELDAALDNVTDLNNKMKGSVRGNIGAELFKRYMSLSNNAETLEEQVSNRQKAAKVAMVAAVGYKNAGQEVNSAKVWKELISKTPEGAINELKTRYQEQNERTIERDIKDIRAARKELLELLETEEGRAEVSKRVEQEIDKRSEALFGKEQKQKIVNFFDKLIIKGDKKLFDATLGLPIAVWNGAVKAVKEAVLLGASAANAVKAGVDYVNKNHNQAWREKEFELMMSDGIKSLKVKPKKVVNETTKGKILDAWEKRLTNLKPESRKKLLSEAINELNDLGALSEQRFKEMYAEAMGLPTLTEEDQANIYDLIGKINQADKDGDAYKKLYDSDASKSELNQAKSKWEKSVREARKANEELSDYFRDKKNIWETLSTIMQGNLLTGSSLLANVWGNITLQPLRLLTGGIGSVIDYTLSQGAKYTALSKYVNKERTIDIIARSKGAWMGVLPGTKEGLQGLVDGVTSEDINKRDVYQKLQPLKSAARLWASVFADKKTTTPEKINDLAEAVLGMPAETVFRLLNLGDKPFRKPAELGRLLEIGTLKGLKGDELAKFLEFPDEESLADAKKAGDFATFQGSNIAEETISRLIKRLKETGNVGQFANFLLVRTTIPFVKTPSNVILENLTYVIPVIPLTTSILKARKGDRRGAILDFSKAIVGTMMVTVAVEIVSKGIASGPPEEDDNPKALTSQRENVPPYSLNISAFSRGMSGQGWGIEDQDVWINYSKMGVFGAVLATHASVAKDKTSEDISKMDIMSTFLASLPNTLKISLEQSFLEGTNAFLTAIKKGGRYVDNLIVDMTNTISSTFYPNTLAVASKTNDDYIRSIKDESVGKEIENMFKNKMFMGDKLPAKVTLWGDPVKNAPEGRGKWMYNLFDITKYREVDTESFGYKLYNEWNKTKNADYLPSIPKQEITVGGEKIKLTPKQYEQYLTLVGKSRKELVELYVNSSNWDENNEDKRLEKLSKLYSQGLKNGRTLFINSIPEFYNKENED